MTGRRAYLSQFVILVLCVVTISSCISAHPTTDYGERVVEEGENISLSCSSHFNITGYRLARVYWRVEKSNGTDKLIAGQECPNTTCTHISAEDRFFVDLDADERTARLIISNVQKSDIGKYVCVVVSMEGIEQASTALIIKPPVDLSCSQNCKFDSSETLVVEADRNISLSCFTSKDIDANVSLSSDDGLKVKQEHSHMISFIPTNGDNGKWVECVVDAEQQNRRNLTLRVVNSPIVNAVTTERTERNMEDTPVKFNGDESRQNVCVFAGVFADGDFLRSSECYDTSEVVILPNDLHNDVGILFCTGDDCQGPFKLKTADNNQFTMATYLSISLYVIIGLTIIFVIIVMLWRKRKVGVRVDVIYDEPLSVSLTHPLRPQGPPLGIEISSPSTSATFSSSYYPSSTRYASSCYDRDDDEFDELESLWSEGASNGKKRSLRRTLSGRARNCFRDSAVMYINLRPAVTLADRVRTLGWSYM